MKKCAIVRNGFFTCPSMDDQINCISNELSKLGVIADILKTDKILASISAGKIKTEVINYDFIVFLDKDVYLSRMLEKAGAKLVNSASSIEICDDKMKTYIALANIGVNLPDTISSPLNYALKEDEFASGVQNKIGFPVVVKEVFGSMGKNVYLAEDEKSLVDLRNKLKSRPHLYQKFIGVGGCDYRVIVIGNKAVGAMERVNEKDFRSNIELGGSGKACLLTDGLKNLAEKVSKTLGLDYCGVDVISDGEKLYVCEVNSNAFFKKFVEVTKINVAKLYAEFLYSKFYGEKNFDDVYVKRSIDGAYVKRSIDDVYGNINFDADKNN